MRFADPRLEERLRRRRELHEIIDACDEEIRALLAWERPRHVRVCEDVLLDAMQSCCRRRSIAYAELTGRRPPIAARRGSARSAS